VPSSALGSYTFSGNVDYGGATNPLITGDSDVIVSGTALPVTLTRNLPGSASAGSTFTVTLTMLVDESDPPSAVGVTEYVPQGWTVGTMSHNGTYTSTEDKIEWLFWYGSEENPVTNQTVTYTVHVPSNASGTNTFTGYYDCGEVTNPEISGDYSVEILPIVVTRYLPSSATAGSSFIVTLDMNIDESDVPDAVGLTEYVPTGWTLTNISHNANYLPDESKVEWLFWSLGNPVEDTLIAYTAHVPSNATGSFSFYGFSDYAGIENPEFVGDSIVNVVDPAPINVTRDLPETAIAGGTLTISLIMDVDESKPPSAAGIYEEIPAGWEVIESSPTANFNSVTNTLEWLFWSMGIPVEDQTITYKLRVPADATLGVFEGRIDYGVGSYPSVRGDTAISVTVSELTGDLDGDGEVTLSEVIDCITMWTNDPNEFTLSEVIDAITNWASG